MDLDEKLWSLLPTELIERMVSFLPVLDLCRLRSVCRRWNELICKESFHDLCEQNRKENAYLFVTRHHDYHDWCEVDPKFKRTMSLFDLDSRRWYSLTPHVEPHVEALLAVYEDDPTCQMLDMDDGLVCDMTISDDGLTISDPVVLTISDPIARMRKELPLLVTMMPDDEAVPIIVTAVDHVTRSYRLFVITDNDEPDRRIFMYESATDEWRGLKSPPVHLGLRTAVSAVSFGGMLYVIFRLFPARRFLLLSYDLQEDVWKLHSLKIPNKKSRPPQLVVSCNRLFTMMWIGEQRPSAHEQGSHRLLFEVREVLVAEFSSRMVVQLTTTQLQQMFGEEDTANFDIAYGVPCFSSSGSLQIPKTKHRNKSRGFSPGYSGGNYCGERVRVVGAKIERGGGISARFHSVVGHCECEGQWTGSLVGWLPVATVASPQPTTASTTTTFTARVPCPLSQLLPSSRRELRAEPFCGRGSPPESFPQPHCLIASSKLPPSTASCAVLGACCGSVRFDRESVVARPVATE